MTTITNKPWRIKESELTDFAYTDTINRILCAPAGITDLAKALRARTIIRAVITTTPVQTPDIATRILLDYITELILEREDYLAAVTLLEHTEETINKWLLKPAPKASRTAMKYAIMSRGFRMSEYLPTRYGDTPGFTREDVVKGILADLTPMVTEKEFQDFSFYLSTAIQEEGTLLYE